MTTAKGGRAAKPMALRLLHGDRKDRLNRLEPLPDPGVPRQPESLTAAARAVWDETVPILAGMGVLTVADGEALVCYCEAVVVLRRASSILAGSDVLIRSENDRPMRNPALLVQRDAMRTVLYFAREFGMTPAARHGVSTVTPRPDEREELLS